MSDFVDGIFNYCDRWCEQCRLSARCRLYADEQRPDALSSPSWVHVTANLRQTEAMLLDACREQGIAVDEDSLAEAGREVRARREAVERDPLLARARGYLRIARDWLDENVSEVDDEDVVESIEVIDRYLLPIETKLSRALAFGDTHERAEQQSDANGSAKVELILLDRSIAAWRVLYELLPDERDAVLDRLLALDRLRRAVEGAFPLARSFVRPGFDKG